MTTNLHLAWRLHRLRCLLTGCICAPNYPACSRCSAPLYAAPDDDLFIDFGKLEPLFRLGYHLKQLRKKLSRNKCEVCSRRYWIGYKGAGGNHLCSEECFDEWLPF